MTENKELKIEQVTDRRLNFRDLIHHFAGAYNGLLDYLENRKRLGLPPQSNCVIWMMDEEGAHVIDTEVLMEAMDKFLTEIEEKDTLVKIKEYEGDNGDSEAGRSESQTDQTENS